MITIGNDIVAISRIRRILNNHGQRFIHRVFTADEQRHCLKFKDTASHFAGRFAAKEAIKKALLQIKPHLKLSWRQINIASRRDGAPQVEIDQVRSHLKIVCSIAHDGDYATAFALVETT